VHRSRDVDMFGVPSCKLENTDTTYRKQDPRRIYPNSALLLLTLFLAVKSRSASTSWLPSLLSQNQRLRYHNILIKPDNVHEEEPPSIQSLSMDMTTERLGTTSLCLEPWLPISGNASIPTTTRTSSRNLNSQASHNSERKRIHHKQSTQASSYTAMPAPELVTNEQARYTEDLTTETR
jgi:hypothetical protein